MRATGGVVGGAATGHLSPWQFLVVTRDTGYTRLTPRAARVHCTASAQQNSQSKISTLELTAVAAPKSISSARVQQSTMFAAMVPAVQPVCTTAAARENSEGRSQSDCKWDSVGMIGLSNIPSSKIQAHACHQTHHMIAGAPRAVYSPRPHCPPLLPKVSVQCTHSIRPQPIPALSCHRCSARPTPQAGHRTV